METKEKKLDTVSMTKIALMVAILSISSYFLSLQHTYHNYSRQEAKIKTPRWSKQLPRSR